jgi:hypothetical protein
LDAQNADVFWCSDSYRRILTAIVTRHPQIGLTSEFLLAEFDGEVAVLIEPCRVEQVLLRRDTRIVQLRCIGDSIIVEPSAIGPVINEFPQIQNKAQVLRRLTELYQGDDKPDNGAWAPASLRLRDALMAFDGRELGMTYREIAKLIFGQERVHHDWSDIDRILKNRTIRAVKRGRRFVDGDYVKLLS